MRNQFGFTKNILLFILSGVGFAVFGWFFIFGKIKATDLISSITQKLPKNEAEMLDATENVLGQAVEKIRTGRTMQKAAEQGSQFVEESSYAEPVRSLRDDIKQKVDETFNSAKDLPAKEIKTIQRQVCREWLGDEVASPSAEQ